MEDIIDGSNGCTKGVLIEKRARPQEQLNCPRCNSTNTKFCYYNNYSLTQPRYFCKTCRRYWTEGGTLRNVPVGGGSRKNRKSIPPPPPPPLSSSSSSSSKIIPDLNPLSLSVQQFPCQNPRLPPHHQGQDLNPSFNDYYYGATQYMEVPKTENDTTSNSNHQQTTYPSGFYLQPTTQLGFCVEGVGSMRYGVQENNDSNINNGTGSSSTGSGRMLFPFGDFKQQVSNAAAHEVDHRNKGQGNNSTGYWNGLLGGGSSW